MKNLSKSILAILATGLLGSALLSQSANATLIAPGGLVNPLPVGPFPGGPLVASSSTAFNNGVISGTLNSFVYSGSSLGGLTFVYQISMSGVMAGEAITQLSAGSYGGFLVDVSQAVFGGGQAATDANRSGGTGNTLRFEFQGSGAGTLDIGENSFYLIAETNANAFQLLPVGLIDSLTVNVNAYVPNVPDGGSTVALLGAALGGIGLLRRKFRRA